MYRANENANRRRGRPQRRWKEEMRELLMGKGFSNRAVLLLARDRDVYNLRGCYGTQMGYKSEALLLSHIKRGENIGIISDNVGAFQIH